MIVETFEDLVDVFELIEILMKKLAITRPDLPHLNYRPNQKTFEELDQIGLIKMKAKL